VTDRIARLTEMSLRLPEAERVDIAPKKLAKVVLEEDGLA
jgi:hypothetical protein